MRFDQDPFKGPGLRPDLPPLTGPDLLQRFALAQTEWFAKRTVRGTNAMDA
jgi:hypothetical protein